MKRILLSSFLWLALSLVAPAQSPVSAWVTEFTNLPLEQREEFSANFNAAKAAYQRQSWSACLTKLAACEQIFDKNPNVNVLRVGCLQELGLYPDALRLVLDHLKQQPNDVVAIYNLSNIYLAMGEYKQCLAVTTPLLSNISMKDDIKYRDLLYYRLLLCNLALKDEPAANAIASKRNMMDDSPFYYMVEAALALYQGNRNKAAENLKIAQRIYGKTMNMPAYEQCLQKSGLVSAWDIAL